MEDQAKFTKRKFLLGLGASIGSLGGLSLLHSCAELAQLNELGSLGLGNGLSPTLLIKPQSIASKLTPNFPYQQSYKGIAEINFADPVVSMVPDVEKVRVGLTTSAGITGSNKQIGGRCQLACKLRYDPDTKGIYLKDATLEDFNLNGVNSQLTSGFTSIANTLGNNILERYPVYSLANRPGAGLLKTMDVTSEGIKVGFGLI